MKYSNYWANRIRCIFWYSLISCLTISQTKAQCNLNDFLALKALYQDTGGDNWNNRSFWDMVSENEAPLPDCDLSFLHGVALNTDGRVNSVGLFNNNLKGELSSAIGDLTHLTSLSLTDNQLRGKLPNEVGQLINLIDLSLSNNMFSGTLPESLSDLKNLEILFLNNNQFSGEIPNGITELDQLAWIFLEQNKLSGNLPLGFGNLSNLTYLSLYQNQLEGNIPIDLEDLDNLKWVLLQQNNMSGCYPSTLCQLNIDSLNFMENPMLPNLGDFLTIDSLCKNPSIQIGLACDDGNNNTINDSIQQDCTCSGDLMIATNEQDNVSTIQTFPNPVVNFIYLQSKNYSLKGFQIINIEGKVVLKADLSNLPFIEVQHLPSGKYFLQINSEQTNLQFIPFIKL